MRNDEQGQKLRSGKCSSIGRAIFSGIDADILLGGEDAPISVMSMTVAPHQGAPEHTSNGEDKVFLVNEGRLIFLVGTEKFIAYPGECIFVSRGIVHSFSALDDRVASMTLVSAPGRHDRFFQAMGALSTPHDIEEVASVCDCFEQAIVGPVVVE